MVPYIEVFKTNVTNINDARFLIGELNCLLPNHEMSFDLEDCDRVFRVATAVEKVNIMFIIAYFQLNNYYCDVLEDEPVIKHPYSTLGH